MAESGFNGHNKQKLSEHISNSSQWTAFGRVSSILNAVVALVMTGVLTWAGVTLLDVQKTSVRTEAQLEDFKADAERSRNDTRDKLTDINARMDRMTSWFSGAINRLTDRVDGMGHQ